MIARPATLPEIDQAVGGRLWRFDRDEYHRMGEAGILRKEDHVELLDGVIFLRHPRGRTLADALYRWRREKYHQLAAAGILQEDDPVELLDGLIMMMSPIGPRHARIASYLNEFFVTRLAGRAICSVDNPLAFGQISEPEPDLMLLKRRDDYYGSAHPQPADVLLLVEVGDSSVDSDLGEKLKLYARAGVAEYWIIDLTRDVLVSCSQPDGERFGRMTEHQRDAIVAPSAFPNCQLRLAELFG